MDASRSDLLSRPRLRGWSHAIACGVAILSTIALCVRGSDEIATLFSLAVYGASTILLYGASATYHLGAWHGSRRAVLRSIDHASIYVLIAGTFTPFCVTLLSGSERVMVLALIWGMAVVGVGASIFTPSLPRGFSVGLYLGMGWMGLIPAPTLIGLLPTSALALLVGGGLLYSVGALVYARRWPNPFPSTFGFHEIFHLLVIAGNTAFLTVIWIWVAPGMTP
jgi:hemolysin III